MPATIVVARSLVYPPPWCGRRSSALGQVVKPAEKCANKADNTVANITLFHGHFLFNVLEQSHFGRERISKNYS